MGSESVHKKLERVRKPHVHITYDVETGGAIEKKELPFVMGVLGDFSGNPTGELPPLSGRKFVPIDRDNFNEVMSKMKPGLNIRVKNTLSPEGGETAVQLKFDSMDDFDPARVVDQVPQLRELMETRNKLRDLLNYVDKSEKLESLLDEILKDAERMKSLAAQLPATGTDKEGDK